MYHDLKAKVVLFNHRILAEYVGFPVVNKSLNKQHKIFCSQIEFEQSVNKI